MKSTTTSPDHRFAPLIDDLAVGGASLVAYLATLAPAITTGDSGELITAAARLELAHPTGYPLYLLLGKAFVSLLFFLPADLALNLFSAVTAAFAVIVTRRLFLSITGDRTVAVATALIFAFSASVWSQATTARVYSLNSLLVAWVLLDLTRLHLDRGGNLARAWCLWGLAMANHTVAVVLLPILLLSTVRSGRGLRAGLLSVAWSVPGLSLYLYIPITASTNPFQNWGNPSTFENLILYLSRSTYLERSFVEGPGDVSQVGWHYVSLLPSEFAWTGLAVLVVGLIIGAAGRSVFLVAGLYLFIANMTLMMLHGSRSDIFFWPRYMITGWLGLTVILALGLAWLRDRIGKKHLTAVLVFALPLVSLASNYRDSDRSGLKLAREFNEKILMNVEEGATVFGEGDNVLFPLIYLHHVEGLRPDVKLVLQGINQLSNMVIDPDKVPIYFTHHHNLGAPELKLVPDGLVYRLVRIDSAFTGRPWKEWAIPSFDSIEEPGFLRYLDRNLVGDYLFMKAISYAGDRASTTAVLERGMAVDWDNTKTHLNAGLIFERNLQFVEARAAFAGALAIDPRDRMARRKTAFLDRVLARVGDGGGPDDRASRLAAALYEDGRRKLAIGVLREAVGAFSQSFKLRYNLAALLIAVGELESARDELETALSLQPDDPAANRDYEQVTRLLEGRLAWHRSGRDIYNGIPSRIEFSVPPGRESEVETIASKAWAEFVRVGTVFDAFEPQSEVGRLNDSVKTDDVALSREVWNLIRMAQELGEGTRGAFDLTVRPLKRLWKEAESTGSLPTPADVARARPRGGMGGIHLSRDGLHARFDRLDTELDFGGIVKGYAVDRVLGLLKESGASSALVQCGGEIGLFGRAADGRPWSVGVRNPVMEGAPWGVISGPDRMAVSTSGNYEQPYRVKGRVFYHIFDPGTGEPIPGTVLGVTVVITGEAPSAALSDGLATALAVLGPDSGLKVLESFPDARALYIVGGTEDDVPREIRSRGLEGIYRLVR